MSRDLPQPVYVTVEPGGALYIGRREGEYRLSMLSKTEPYPYGTWVDVDVCGDMEGRPQWVPFRAINHTTDTFGQLWIKVTAGVDGEEDHKFFVRSQFVRHRVFATRDSSKASSETSGELA